MRRSSESVAALAAALAKAQGELVNPEKSETATIRTGRPGGAERSFRYASLASGLEIVRKTLGKHEIATVQTTEIDQTARMVSLTTTLAHSSGEWIASDWPVCPIADMASPQRMGTALTYARRYALFTLVGIAGEDDLDAPDLCASAPPPASVPLNSCRNGISQVGNAQYWESSRAAGNRRRGAHARPEPSPTLDAAQSTTVREKLMAEVAKITSPELAAQWAKGAIAAKNSLRAGDAKLVEQAFEKQTSQLPSAEGAIPANREMTQRTDGAPPAPPGEAETTKAVASQAALAPQAGATSQICNVDGGNGGNLDVEKPIDKSVLAIATPRRYRNPEHLRSLIKQPCLVCGRKPSDPHHLRFAQLRALGRKASDEFTVPLCRMHHREVHRAGNEQAWWKAAGIDPLKSARKFWKETRLKEGWIAPTRPVKADEGRGSESHDTSGRVPA
jgi:hypothetical protein